jgi:hypothetical protein
MRWLPFVALVSAATALCGAEGAYRTIRFGKDELGKLPAGWKADRTGKGEGSVWQVVADDTAPSKSGRVLAQTAAGPSPLFNLCVLQDSSFTDVEIEVAFKAVKGEIDQGGGIVWRYQDASNYYIARMNPLESNFRLYKVVNGKRMQLATHEDIALQAGTWHTIQIATEGERIECKLDGKQVFEAKDSTFAKPGQIGLWTKADAQTYFDDLKFRGK